MIYLLDLNVVFYKFIIITYNWVFKFQKTNKNMKRGERVVEISTRLYDE